MTVSSLTPLQTRAIEVAPGINEDQFRHLAAGLSSIVWRTNFDGTRLVAPRWAELTGKTEAELQGGWLLTIHSNDRMAFSEALRTARIHKAHCDIDFRLRLRDGSYHWFHARGEPSRDARGGVTGLIGIATNIDVQKRAEAALVESESRLRLILDAARVGTIDHDLPTNRIVAGPLTATLFGLPPGVALTFDRVIGQVHPDDRPTFKRAIELARTPSGDGKYEAVFRAVHPNGDIVWLSTRGTYLFEGEGEARHAMRFIGVSTDITGRMRDLEERARLSAIVASSSDAIVCMTKHCIVTHWNSAAERVYGFTAEEILGKSMMCTVPADLIEESRARLDAIVGGSPVTGLLTERLTKRGDRISVSLTLSPIYDEAGNSIGISSIIRDVTQQTQLQAQLAQAQKMEAIGQLAGGVAHDLNNFLTSMLIGIEFACESAGVSDDTRAQFGAVRAEGYRAAGLIRQLLTVARRQVINPRPSDIGDVVRETLPVLRSVLGADIEISTSLQATRGVFIDPAQIGQVILNLGINARDAMPRGGTLTVATEDGPESESIVLRVADTGCGMTAEVKAHVFEPFFTTKGDGLGSGLGLSTTYGIVVQSRGTIAVDSEKGVGTTFTMTFPAIDAPMSIGKTPPLAVGVAASAGTTGGNETILIVEDDRIVRDGIARGLERFGYRVVEAQNARDALIIMRDNAESIDLVLSDLVMPGMNGAELVTHVQTKFPRTRAMLMSGYSERALSSLCAAIPQATLVQKPFELSLLAAKLREEFSREREPTQSAATAQS
ncbi:MAG: PAS domain S-box protein [Gemmatimonadaceae bacterium]